MDHIQSSTAAPWSPAERRRLAHGLASAKRARDYRRIQAVLWVAEGMSISEVARRCRVDRTSVQRWQRRFLTSRTTAALSDGPRSGRPRESSQLTNALLGQILVEDPRKYGYQATGWTVPLLGRHLQQHKGITVGERTLRRRLHESGFCWKRPRYVFSQRASHLPQKKGGLSAA